MSKKIVDDTYLGDGVYASFDGYHIWVIGCSVQLIPP